MRVIKGHVPPSATQPAPFSTASDFVMGQVRRWDVYKRHGASDVREHFIHTASAQTIAAWWQSPGPHGIGMAQFASTGTVTDALLSDIARERAHVPDGPDCDALRALDAYVLACTVPVWTVGRNIAGYLPESDVTPFLDYADAVDYFRTEVEQAPDALADDEDCTCVDGGELCEFDSLDAEVKSYLADDVPAVVNGRVFGAARELAIALRPESASLPTVYWLNRAEMTVAEYLAEREGN